ncbi:MAG: hypothetical protein JJU03_12760 [Idiomarina sp.]|nr:hypothetical protein [Idiomarina sp.]
MNTLRSLILLLLMSALASASQAHSATAVDGYQDQADAQHSILITQEYEGDEPDALVGAQAFISPADFSSSFAALSAPATVANYSDFLARAPPHHL